MTLRLIVAARKSRSGSSSEDERYARQDNRAAERAERDGHHVVTSVHDTVSSQSAPWQRKELKAWMTDTGKLAMYDGILVSEADRLSRTDDRGWHDIEAWCYEAGKVVLTADNVMFPPRDDSDRYQWLGMKRRARTYWEDTRDKQGDTRQHLLAVGAAIGKPPFGYRTAPAVSQCSCGRTHKRFEIDPVTGPIALEVFRRIIDGQTASAVATWLGAQLTVVPFAPVDVRAKRIIDMVKSSSYLGERDGHVFPLLAPNMAELIDSARVRLDSRSFDRGGNRVTHAYSSRIYCACGASLHHHQSTRNGAPVGTAKYRCSRGRRGIAGEARCEFGAFGYDATNEAVEAAMGAVTDPDGYTVTTGGEAQRQATLDALAKDIERAVKVRDYARAGELQATYEQAEATSAEVTTKLVLTGKTEGEWFLAADLEARRARLTSKWLRVYVTAKGVEVMHLDREDGPWPIDDAA